MPRYLIRHADGSHALLGAAVQVNLEAVYVHPGGYQPALIIRAIPLQLVVAEFLKLDSREGSLWIAGSYSQNAFNEAFQERFASFSHVMNELKKAQIEWEFFLRDPSVWS